MPSFWHSKEMVKQAKESDLLGSLLKVLWHFVAGTFQQPQVCHVQDNTSMPLLQLLGSPPHQALLNFTF